MFFNKTVKNLNRIREMINILIKYGFDDIIANTALRRLIAPRNSNTPLSPDKPVVQYTRWERIRLVVEELGSTFIKLAQLLSNRPDLLPAPLILEFEKLQSEAPAVEFEVIESIIEAEFGTVLSELFSYFDKQALGSASIGQVHRAKLRNGENVVIKVQKPGVRAQVSTDLALLRDFIRLTESYFKNIGLLNPLEIVDTFEASMKKELDYQIEARNMTMFREIYQEEADFYIPKPYSEYSTDKVLTAEFISGCKITDSAQLLAWGLDSRQIVERGMDIYLKQIFDYGLFHADPHPGNILVRPNGTLVLIDFGMVGKLMKHQKFALAGIFVGLANQDAKAMAIHLRRLAVENEIDNIRLFENDLNALIEDFMLYGWDEAGVAEFTGHLQRIIYKYRLQIPGPIFLILRTLAILEGIGRSLHPQFDTLKFIKPYGRKLLAEQFSFKNQRSELSYSLSQVISLLYIFPIEIKFILKKLRSGELNIHLVIKGYEQLVRQMEIFTNRLVMTLISCTLILSSALMVNAAPRQAATLLGLPVLSLIGFSVGSAMAAWLFLRSFLTRPHRERKRL